LEPPKAKTETCWRQRTRAENARGERRDTKMVRYWIQRKGKRKRFVARERDMRIVVIAESWITERPNVSLLQRAGMQE
jgi:hypothetical protein